MPQTHVPVLAGELIEALDPQPGQIAVDCTLGGAGHARLVAERLGPTGTLIAIDRDPTAGAAFAELSHEVACETRFIRADFVSGLAQLLEEGVRADLAYMDLGMSSMQVDNRERGFAYACVAIAPTCSFAHGTTEPTARNFDCVATPHCAASRSQAQIE